MQLRRRVAKYVVEDSYVDILREHMDVDIGGETVNSRGEVVGSHRRLYAYTIGKRRGLEGRGATKPICTLYRCRGNREIVGERGTWG